MATPETRSNSQQGKPPDEKPAIVLPSVIASHVSTIVGTLESLPEAAQRRILEGARVSLGLMPLKQPDGQAKR